MTVFAEALDDIALLRWYDGVGADECVGETPVDRFAADAARQARRAEQARPRAAPSPTARAAPSPPAPTAAPPSAATEGAAAAAARAHSLDQLRQVLEGFDGCPLKVTATNTVFGEGAADAALMVVGEAPGADEDRQGRPFCGVSGRLLDDMLASIGFDRSTAYITNVVPWRPPGNRKPTPAEVAVCVPFIERHVALIAPKVLLLVGGLAASTLLGATEGITRLRGQWRAHQPAGGQHEIAAMPTFHPAYLLRTPEAKRLAWRDLLAIKARLEA
ncbi:uracil-DNA glycosylase [Rhodospira trueperi]|uniref:Type-4 uracil-DNA glycosylase n=1 Tax=Rhodospira trueperi TaxID=69960 RepID=A0A1G7BX16_9PROT|nr:uracil-DNA glycosylase [Rhodospira trueperi]SDE31597.1 DNA polymerase [Rhodospira trueperi]